MSDIVWRQTMVKKIFKSIVLVASATLVLVLAVIILGLYGYIDGVAETNLKSELRLAVGGTESMGADYLKTVSSDEYRITWVDTDGTVLYDSVADAETMQNHADRQEIKDAFTYGRGSSKRYSETMTVKTVYEAVRLSDNTVLRISVSQATALALLIKVLYPVILVLVFIVIMSLCFARHMSERIVKPLNTLNLDNPLENKTYDEILPLLYRIKNQQTEITERVRQLDRQKAEFSEITDNMKEALILLDGKLKIISINTAAKKLFEITGSTSDMGIFAVDRSIGMRDAVLKTEKDGASVFEEERNGFTYSFNLSRIDLENGEHGIVILAFDITDKANAEKNRREFTANVSHELKTPLQSIIGASELLENGIVKPCDIQRFAGNIHSEALRLHNLVNDIIRLSRLDENVKMPLEYVSLHEIADEVKEELNGIAAEKDINFTVSGEKGMINGVRSLLYEMIYNLSENAIKYNNPGGFVNVDIKEDDGHNVLTVCDNGIGIAPEFHEKIFERFYRVDKSRSRASGGTGLGLSIVKHAAMYHNAEISVESAEGKGTKITVRF